MFLEREQISVPLKNTLHDLEAYRELVQGGGRGTVPCLRIEHNDKEVQWLYESLDIMDYFAQSKHSG